MWKEKKNNNNKSKKPTKLQFIFRRQSKEIKVPVKMDSILLNQRAF